MRVISKVRLDDQGRAAWFTWRRFTPGNQAAGDLEEVDRQTVVDVVIGGEVVTTNWLNDTGQVLSGPNIRIRIDEQGTAWPVLDIRPDDRRRIEQMPKF